MKFSRWRRSNPFSGAPVMPNAEQLDEDMERRRIQFGWPTFRHPDVDDIAAFIEYIQAAYQSLPTELQPYISAEWSFGPWTPTLIHLPRDWDRINVTRYGMAPEGTEGIVVDFGSPEYWNEENQSHHRTRIPPQEPAYIENDQVWHFGEQYIDELMAGGKWAYPIDENDQFIDYQEKREYPAIEHRGLERREFFEYEGVWRFIGQWHPAIKSEQEFGHWLGDYWRNSLGLPEPKRPYRRRT